MAVMLLVFCGLLLVQPSRITAAMFNFGGGCRDYASKMEDQIKTQQGYNLIQDIMKNNLKVFMWNPSAKEENNKNISLKIDFDASDENTIYNFYNKDGAEVTIRGSATYVHNEHYIDLQLKATTQGEYKEVLGADNNDKAKLYPIYVSDYEIIFRSCCQVFMGSLDMMYMFTKEKLNPTLIDNACAAKSIKKITGVDTVNPDAA